MFHDRDGKFTFALDADLAKRNIEVRKTAFRAPNTNAYVERFIQTIQQECLDHFVILGQQHFDYLVTEWLEHYHLERPHQGKENELLCRQAERAGDGARAPSTSPSLTNSTSDVLCTKRLGGLLKHYSRKAA